MAFKYTSRAACEADADNRLAEFVRATFGENATAKQIAEARERLRRTEFAITLPDGTTCVGNPNNYPETITLPDGTVYAGKLPNDGDV